MTRPEHQPTFTRTWLLWTAGFVAFPIAGVAGTAAAGRVDSPTAALLGGAVTGLVLGPDRHWPAVVASTRAGGSRRPGQAWRSGCSSAPRPSTTAPLWRT